MSIHIILSMSSSPICKVHTVIDCRIKFTASCTNYCDLVIVTTKFEFNGVTSRFLSKYSWMLLSNSLRKDEENKNHRLIHHHQVGVNLIQTKVN